MDPSRSSPAIAKKDEGGWKRRPELPRHRPEPRARAATDITEDLAIARAPFCEAPAAEAAGWVQDSITVAMLLRLHHMAHEGELDAALKQAVLG